MLPEKEADASAVRVSKISDVITGESMKTGVKPALGGVMADFLAKSSKGQTANAVSIVGTDRHIAPKKRTSRSRSKDSDNSPKKRRPSRGGSGSRSRSRSRKKRHSKRPSDRRDRDRDDRRKRGDRGSRDKSSRDRGSRDRRDRQSKQDRKKERERRREKDPNTKFSTESESESDMSQHAEKISSKSKEQNPNFTSKAETFRPSGVPEKGSIISFKYPRNKIRIFQTDEKKDKNDGISIACDFFSSEDCLSLAAFSEFQKAPKFVLHKFARDVDEIEEHYARMLFQINKYKLPESSSTIISGWVSFRDPLEKAKELEEYLITNKKALGCSIAPTVS